MQGRFIHNRLHMEAFRGKKDAVLKLIQQGDIDVNSQNEHANTPVMVAVVMRQYEVAKILIVQGQANLNIADEYSKTALHYAVQREANDLINLMLEYRADPAIPDYEGNTAIDYAMDLFQHDIVEQILDQYPGVLTVKSNNLLHRSVLNHANQLVKKIIDLDIVSLTQKNKEGFTPLELAQKCNNTAAQKLLSETPLHRLKQDQSSKDLSAFNIQIDPISPDRSLFQESELSDMIDTYLPENNMSAHTDAAFSQEEITPSSIISEALSICLCPSALHH